MSSLSLQFPMDESNKENEDNLSPVIRFSCYSPVVCTFTKEEIEKFLKDFIDFIQKNQLWIFTDSENYLNYLIEIITNNTIKYNFCFSLEREFSEYRKNPYNINNLFYLIRKHIIEDKINDIDHDDMDRCHILIKELILFYQYSDEDLFIKLFNIIHRDDFSFYEYIIIFMNTNIAIIDNLTIKVIKNSNDSNININIIKSFNNVNINKWLNDKGYLISSRLINNFDQYLHYNLIFYILNE